MRGAVVAADVLAELRGAHITLGRFRAGRYRCAQCRTRGTAESPLRACAGCILCERCIANPHPATPTPTEARAPGVTCDPDDLGITVGDLGAV